MDFIILSSDHDSSVRNKSHSIHEISSDSETKMGDISDRGESAFANHPAVRRKPTSLRQPRLSSEPKSQPSRSDDEEEVLESDVESVAKCGGML
ncbi:hypothetical protein FRC12_017118 [Ceratobasidium sp. 428]|nr:hypothetical protein FRC12_017118 [Ceratobasidium sp. 428]